MFITVRFGDCEESLFNPNCRIEILLDAIKRRCNCTKDATVDLSDEAGNLKYLGNHPLSYASELLKARESFVLIRVEKRDEAEDRLSRCENDSLSAKNSASKPVRISSGSLQRKHMGLKGKSSSQVSASARNKTSREKTPGQKRNKESR